MNHSLIKNPLKVSLTFLNQNEHSQHCQPQKNHHDIPLLPKNYFVFSIVSVTLFPEKTFQRLHETMKRISLQSLESDHEPASIG